MFHFFNKSHIYALRSQYLLLLFAATYRKQSALFYANEYYTLLYHRKKSTNVTLYTKVIFYTKAEPKVSLCKILCKGEIMHVCIIGFSLCVTALTLISQHCELAGPVYPWNSGTSTLSSDASSRKSDMCQSRNDSVAEYFNSYTASFHYPYRSAWKPPCATMTCCCNGSRSAWR